MDYVAIEDLDLSVRSYNCLKRAGINSLEEIIERTEEELFKIRNLGRKNLEEIECKINGLGFCLKDKEVKYTDIVFKCRKCEHLLFVDNRKVNPIELAKIAEEECSNCGEEGYENWILVRAGNFEEEYGGR